MLRVLMAVIGLLPMLGYAEISKYQEPEKAAVVQQRNAIDDAMKQADQNAKDGTLDKLLNQERGALSGIPRNMPGLNIQMPEYLEKERDSRYLAKAIAAGKSIDKINAAAMDTKYLIVLVSLSMPESQIKELIAEAYQIGAVIAVRGLIEDDFQKTLIKLKQLAGEKEGGVLIDPTLFSRFEATAAPTFILPLEPLQQCTDQGCPTPRHVKATGSASFQYFLDLVARTGDNNERTEAGTWLAKYGN